jgi:glycosyltransferase involved in cell wall biosynthesis
MPVHNGDRFVADALDSVLAQSFRDFAVLVIDDASTDRTGQVLRRFTDCRVRVIRSHEQLGPAGARNVGLEEAQSRYVAFVDSDDVAARRLLEAQVGYLQAHREVKLVATRVAVVDENGQPTGALWGHEGDPGTIAPSMLFANRLATSSIAVDRAFIRDERFDRTLPVASDYDMWLRLLGRGQVACLPDVLVHYRSHAANLSHTRSAAAEGSLRRIARVALARLGIEPSEEEVDIHRALGAARPSGTASFLEAAQQWLADLDCANTATGSYDRERFRRVLRARWLDACEAAAADGCWSAWPRILGSPLSRGLMLDSSTVPRLTRLPWRLIRGSVRQWLPSLGPAVRAMGRRRQASS